VRPHRLVPGAAAPFTGSIPQFADSAVIPLLPARIFGSSAGHDMTKLMAALAVVGAATGTLATSLIWTLLTDPTTIAVALEQGNLRSIVAALVGAW
jgi:hypothetical protein